MAQVNVRIDDNLKVQSEKLFNSLGLNLSSAINIFISQAVREQAIPFKICLDPFYSNKNISELKASINDMKNGKTVEKTFEELEAMENE